MSSALQVIVEATSRKITVKNQGVLINGDSVPVELTFTTASTSTRPDAGTPITLGIKADGSYTGSLLASCDTWTRGATDDDPYTGTLALTGEALNTALANSATLKAMLEVTWGATPTTSQVAAVTVKNDLNRVNDAPPVPSATFTERVQAAVASDLATKSDVGHTHDGRYYTETETDALLAGKSDTNHNHSGTYSPVSLTINTQTSDYTLMLSDVTAYVRVNKITAVNLTVPPNSSVAFPVGTQIPVRAVGAGQVTIIAGSGVTINKPSSRTLTLTEQGSTATLIKVGADEWDLTGDLA